MPELSNEEKDTDIGNEQKPRNKKLSIVKDNYTIHSSFDDDSDSVFEDTNKMTSRKEENNLKSTKSRLVVMKSNNQIKELQTIIWNR